MPFPQLFAAQRQPSPPLPGQQQGGGVSLLEDMLRAAASQQAVGSQAASPPPLGAERPRDGELLPPGSASRLQQGGLGRKPGTQHVVKTQQGRENRWVDVMDRQHDGRGPRADMEALNAALAQLADSLMPTPEERATQQAAFDAVSSLLQARWPGARVHLFGSVANGLSVRHNNDIDVCLELEGIELDDTAAKGEVAVAVGELMEAAGMADVLPLPKARVPVVKFVVPKTGTKVDVTVNNMLACANTKLLADYCAIDGRLAPLVALVKHWAKNRAVNDAYRGTLSSYCYVLMCIHLLQTRPVPVLPVLQQLPPTFRRTVGQWTCEFCDDVASLRGFGSANRENLAELLWAFFEYWAWRHNYTHDVVSIRLGGCLHKDDKDWTRRIGNERHLVCIEDPFELSHDLGRTVDRQTRAVLHKEFTRAATLLRDRVDPMDELFSPYKAGRR